MAELLNTERLQPSLLDRLTDHAPDKNSESREERVLSMRQLKLSVLRDLNWLFNTPALNPLQDLSDYPDVAQSVLNYGVPAFSGAHLGGALTAELTGKIFKAIRCFEPRIFPESLKIELIQRNDEMSHLSLSFNIEADLWAQPLPIHLYLRSDIDMIANEVKIKDMGG